MNLFSPEGGRGHNESYNDGDIGGSQEDGFSDNSEEKAEEEESGADANAEAEAEAEAAAMAEAEAVMRIH